MIKKHEAALADQVNKYQSVVDEQSGVGDLKQRDLRILQEMRTKRRQIDEDFVDELFDMLTKEQQKSVLKHHFSGNRTSGKFAHPLAVKGLGLDQAQKEALILITSTLHTVDLWSPSMSNEAVTKHMEENLHDTFTVLNLEQFETWLHLAGKIPEEGTVDDYINSIPIVSDEVTARFMHCYPVVAPLFQKRLERMRE